jgi:ketosteroid isomerase-like protein
MAHPNEELVRKASDAWTSRDYDTFLEYHHQDVVVHTPRGETLRGHDELRKNFEELDQMIGEAARPIHDVLPHAQHGIVLAQERVTKDGETIDVDQFVVIHLRDGKAAEVWVSLTDPSVMAKLMPGAA